jgi:hypothetical protein
MANFRKIGKENRKKGSEFEKLVREDLGYQWLICKFPNNVDLEKTIIVPSKPKFNPFTKQLMMNTSGFPDFMCWRKAPTTDLCYEIIGVECKSDGVLSKEEKEKCLFYLKAQVFNRILIASYRREKMTAPGHKKPILMRTKEIVYREFEYGK